jgi:hypothetical protein
MGKDNIYRYPLAPHLLSHWTPMERTGTIELPLGRTGRVLCIRYVQYRPPEYFLGGHFLGSVNLDGQPLRVTEKYSYHTVNNSGQVKWKGLATSEMGQCACSEIVMAHDAGQLLVLMETEPDLWVLEANHKVDQSFHEMEYDDYRCTGRLDVQARALILERSYFRDAST